jgi:hypothetical protein
MSANIKCLIYKPGSLIDLFSLFLGWGRSLKMIDPVPKDLIKLGSPAINPDSIHRPLDYTGSVNFSVPLVSSPVKCRVVSGLNE